ncbi:dihydrolipoyl dehydrogenase family protein [Spirosoma fluviale]|uniref:Pyruvate/2-oxoglutarate dehydrogenase complex, dihydrolipoamide dehydrogenase (E3) component n=1 Tax=Spirosoma fluviale TaxID=1597977 RepID=A0A286FGT1_9BACT|nr:FAD-dependent oxidoreductase [Spirosoma fluviale]SOD82435.1 Pyruvate/2-oxoglutarate dehydrogenase complex, dihydrolipoamide dehydrogenase (E3) component [Spirosoma fluviale]
MTAFDLIVIGAGSGGLSIGLSMHELGFRVLLIEKEEQAIGGECLNTGCVPSKALIHVTRLIQEARRAEAFGMHASGKPDFERVKQYINERIEHIRSHENADYFRHQGMGVVIGTAHFTGPNSVAVSGQVYTAKRIVIATGSQPIELQVPGVEQVKWYDNRTIFSMPTLPARLLVVGGGPIAVELSQAFHRLGSQVTVVQAGDGILEKESPEVSRLLLERLSLEGIAFRLQTKLINFPSAHTATLENKSGQQSQLDFDAVLVAIGRQIDVTGLQPEAAGIQTESGRLKLDAHLRTTNPRVYAIGDVTGQLYFSHTPEMQAPILINNFLSPFKQKVDYRNFSWVTFTDPEVATFGLTEAQLQQQGIRYEKIVYAFTEDDRAVVDDYTYGKLWLYLSPGRSLLSKRKLLGGSVVAPQAGEMIQDLIMANTFDLGAGAIRQKIYPYPVASRVSKMALLDQLKREIPAWAKAILRRLY